MVVPPRDLKPAEVRGVLAVQLSRHPSTPKARGGATQATGGRYWVCLVAARIG